VIEPHALEGFVLMLPELALDPLDQPDAPAATDPRVVALVRAHHGYVWRLCRRLGLGESDADDAVQQVFITAARRFPDIHAGRERAFLYGVALNVVAKWRQAHARRREDTELDLDRFEADALDVEDLADQRQARRLLDAILDAMPRELGIVLVLYELEEQTVAEIAETLGVPLGTAASRLRRAREDFTARVSRWEARHRFEGAKR
jgi:RNA polymerase sigma-70 factor (ECF subfamily)